MARGNTIVEEAPGAVCPPNDGCRIDGSLWIRLASRRRFANAQTRARGRGACCGMATKLSLKARRHAITGIIEARFSISAFEDVRRKNPEYWRSPRNDMARGIYGEAMREKQRLVGASDELLEAEGQAIRLAR